jgi:cysteinyl-tRNA synthetase
MDMMTHAARRNAFAATLVGALLAGCPAPWSDGGAAPPLLSEVRTWAYQIQGLDENGASAALAASRYDLLVLEPTRTDFASAGARDFDTAGMVARLKASPAGDGLHRKLVIAYIDIGEAENWRWYWTWSQEWPGGQPRPADWPDWIVTPDPDGWEGNFPVAFWDEAWKDIVIYGRQHPPAAGRDFVSVLDEVLNDGFDGVYLDWVEAYADAAVAAAAAGVDPAAEMVAFIDELRAYARARNPDFLIIQQNAPELIEDDPAILDVLDAIGQEDTWYGGEADCDWNAPCGYGRAQNAADTQETLRLLDAYRAAGKPVFTIDYTVEQATAVYDAALARGYVPYCSRTSLSRLTTTPPPDY